MIKPKKLKLARETLVILSSKSLACAGGGIDTRASLVPGCEPSGILQCPTVTC